MREYCDRSLAATIHGLAPRMTVDDRSREADEPPHRRIFALGYSLKCNILVVLHASSNTCAHSRAANAFSLGPGGNSGQSDGVSLSRAKTACCETSVETTHGY